MTGTVAEIESIFDDRDWLATQIADMYSNWSMQRNAKKEEWKELSNYLFATSTKDTANATLPWKNTTTIPKLAQIRDNLHANYMAALFPNDDWFKWEGHSAEAEVAVKRESIEAYMKNKLQQNGFYNTVSDLLYDYIDYGNVIADTEFSNEEFVNEETGEIVQGYIGPRALRISPFDIVFNPTAVDFAHSPKITRYIKSVGELIADSKNKPELAYSKDVVDKIDKVRTNASSYDAADDAKAEPYSIEGFGSLMEYYTSDYVEILEFEGNIHDQSGKLLENQIITIVDRSHVIRMQSDPSWLGRSSKVHAAWRSRPDNLYGMGPLDNLVGMQYRMDHLENIQADLMDLIAHPPLKIRGNVEEFTWGPFAEIFLGDDGDIDILSIDSAALRYDTKISILEQRMEDMAGAPRQAMGIRTPGEKTAFEVQSLDNASGRIFQDRIRYFEINIVEPLLNHQLETARRNMDTVDLVRVMDDDLGVASFLQITKNDITAEGKLRPKGSRHFAATAQLIQNLNGVFSSQIGQIIRPHISSKSLAAMVEEAFGWEKYDLVGDNVGVTEEVETQRLVNAGQSQLEVEALTPGVEGEPENI